MAKPARIASTGSIIPLTFSVLSILLARNAAPGVPFDQNPVCLLGALVAVLAFGMLLIPRLFKWGWESKYYGTSLFNLGSLTLIFLSPYLCLVIYGKLSITVKAAIFFSGVTAHIIWCRRFVIFYRKVKNTGASKLIYQEDTDAVYYMQQADKYVMEKEFKFNQFPSGRYFLLFSGLAFFMMPFMDSIRSVTGIPFMHVFFIVGTMPISLMATGISTRAWLIFYYYPMEIKSATGKQVYVDMSSSTSVLNDGRY
jgi:hypothetical protein